MEDFDAAPMWKEQLDWDSRFDLGRRRREHAGNISFAGEAGIADANHLVNLMRSTDAAIGQLTGLVKQWDAKHSDTISLAQEELQLLETQRVEAECKRHEILNDAVLKSVDRRSVLEEKDITWTRKITTQCTQSTEISCAESNSFDDHTVEYWKEKAEKLNQLLDGALCREKVILKQLEDLGKSKSAPMPIGELQQQLERVDNFLHFVLRNAPISIFHQDKDLRYRFAYNQHPSYQHIIGKTENEFYNGTSCKELMDLKIEVMRRGLPAKREIAFEGEEIGKKSFYMAFEPVFSKAGDVIGVNTVAMDVTHEVEKREQLAKLREEAAVQRAREIELVKTIQITEETMRAKQILATMSHEIRSPLSGVVSMGEILSTTKLDAEQRELVDVMLTSGDLVLQLINDILDLSKVESGVLKLEMGKFRPREVVKNVLQMAVASAQNKDLILEGLVVDEVPSEVIGDVLRVRQIFINLISNAIKFTEDGLVGVVIRVISNKDRSSDPSRILLKHKEPPKNAAEKTTEQEIGSQQNKDDRIWLHCEVFDSGIGIPEAATPFLFQKYMQVAASHARKYGGTGLGLAICKQLVDLMGGELKVASKENQGSTFTFTLPCHVPTNKIGHFVGTNIPENGYFKFSPRKRTTSRPTTDSQTKQQQGVKSASYSNSVTEQHNNEPPIKCSQQAKGRASDLDTENNRKEKINLTQLDKKPPKILLAEDNHVNVLVARSMLKRLGIEPEVVNNGAEAVQAVKRSQYDLILMDICMPVMDGLEATRLIRSYEETCNKRTPIIAMTANALADDVAECYAHGMDCFVAKPATFKRLEHVLKKFLSTHGL